MSASFAQSRRSSNEREKPDRTSWKLSLQRVEFVSACGSERFTSRAVLQGLKEDIMSSHRSWSCFGAIRKTLGLALIMSACATAALAGAPGPAPEIDPGSVGAGLMLLACGFFLLLDRCHRKSAPPAGQPD
jgi:hypothetical protein